MANSTIDIHGNNVWRNAVGNFHRDDGPAVIYTDGTKCWCLNGETMTFNRWLDEVDITDEAKVMMKLNYG